jgi:hypothetical protein
MNMMNFDLAHKQLAVRAGGSRRRVRSTPAKPLHRPSVALILLATAVQIIAMAAVLGAIVTAVQ